MIATDLHDLYHATVELWLEGLSCPDGAPNDPAKEKLYERSRHLQPAAYR